MAKRGREQLEVGPLTADEEFFFCDLLDVRVFWATVGGLRGQYVCFSDLLTQLLNDGDVRGSDRHVGPEDARPRARGSSLCDSETLWQRHLGQTSIGVRHCAPLANFVRPIDTSRQDGRWV